MRLLAVVFVLIGVVLVSLSVLLPVLMEIATERRGVSSTFGSGYLRSLSPFITIASMASCFISATAILSFEKSKPSRASIFFSVLTLSVFVAEIALSIYLSIVRPISPAALASSTIYVLIGLVPFGLGCTMFTLASMATRGL